jgi:hypothetical protein
LLRRRTADHSCTTARFASGKSSSRALVEDSIKGQKDKMGLVFRTFAGDTVVDDCLLHGCSHNAAAGKLFLMTPTTLYVIAVLGIAALILTTGTVPRLRTAPSVGVRGLAAAYDSTAHDALDLVRMDDDGGGQMTRRPA